MATESTKKYSSRLTAPGISLLTFGTLGILLGRLLGIFEIFILGICTFPLLLLAFLANRYLKKIEVSCQVQPIRVACRKKAILNINFFPAASNKKLRGASVKINNIVSPEDALHQDFISNTRYSLSPAGNNVELEIHTYKRGLLDIGPLEIELTDPFGLSRSIKETRASCQLIVHPPFWQIDPPVYYSDIQPDRETSYVGVGNEFHSIKKYEPGNNLRLIHWPSTARQGDLMVRQNTTAYSEANLINIFIDNRPESDPDKFEDMLSAATSMAMACKFRGDDIRILTSSNEMESSASTDSDSSRLLDFLSLLEQGAQKNSVLTSNAVDFILNPQSGICIAFLGHMNPQDEQRISEASAKQPFLNKYEYHKNCFVFFENQIPINFPSLNIPAGSSFIDAWKPEIFV